MVARRILDIEGIQRRADEATAERINKAKNGAAPVAEAQEPFPLSLIHSAAEFSALNIPPRESIIDGLMATKTLTEVFAKRGLGKTMLVLYFAVAVARGDKQFLSWTINKARRVLYVDGEMSGSELQERLRKFAGTSMPELLDILASDTFYQTFQRSMNLANEVQQTQFIDMLDALAAIDRAPEVIILDNKSALTFGTEENSSTEQQGFMLLLKALRHKGFTVVVVHHAGKSGDQRGSTGFEDPLDLVLKLEAPVTDENDSLPPAEGAAFRITFTKHRGQKRPQPHLLDVELMEDMDGTFDWAIKKPEGKNNLLKVLEYMYDHPEALTQVAIARGVNKDTGYLSTFLKNTLRPRKFVVGDSLKLTDSGRAYVEAARRNKRRDSGEED
jgi:putative DNA primase/helicase